MHKKLLELNGHEPLLYTPMSPEKFQGDAAAEMEKKKILGVTGRHVVVAGKAG